MDVKKKEDRHQRIMQSGDYESKVKGNFSKEWEWLGVRKTHRKRNGEEKREE